MKQFHVYEDWTLEETPRCFYVGKGDDGRVARLKRSGRHFEIATSLGQRRIVTLTTTSEGEALDFERKLILERHVHPRDPEYNGIGCNRTLGGQGNSGRIVTDETKQRISEAKKGKHPNKIWSDKERRATSERMSRLHKGKTISEEQKQLLREAMNDPERKQKMIAAVTAKINDKYANDPEFAQRIRDTRVRGERSSQAHFTEQSVREMRQEWDATNRNCKGNVKKFCEKWALVGSSTPMAVYYIVKRKSWKHVA
jgi:hypothetical protein